MDYAEQHKLGKNNEFLQEHKMEEENNENKVLSGHELKNQYLQNLEDLVTKTLCFNESPKANLAPKLTLSRCVSRNGNALLCMWQRDNSRLKQNKTKNQNVGVSLQYLPTFYVIATFNESLVETNQRKQSLVW